MKKQYIVVIGMACLLFSCVSKKKYTSLQSQYEISQNERSNLEELLSRLAVENDSLKRQLDILDSLYRVEKDKNENVIAKGGTRSIIKSKSASKRTISVREEYDKRATYLYNFIPFIHWPTNLRHEKFLIGVVGDSPLNASLAALTYGKSIGNVPILVEPFTNHGKEYSIIYVSQDGQKDFHKIIKNYSTKPVLIVTENPYLEKAGAHISMVLDGSKIKFSVNKPAFQKSGLEVSEKLVNFSLSN